MTVEKDQSTENKGIESTVDRPDSVSRRMMLRRGVTAMPAILTLHSGAALARSSNLISASRGSRDSKGKVWCLDTSTATYHSDIDKYDYGDHGHATVNVIPDRVYYGSDRRSGERMTADQFCEAGGTGRYRRRRQGSVRTVNLESPGIVVSANAYNSVSTRIDVWKKDWTNMT